MKTLRAALALSGLLPWLHVLVRLAHVPSLGRAIELAFQTMCHHDPARTLSVQGVAMCVCSRCAGLYAGIALAALSPVAVPRTPASSSDARRVAWGRRTLLAAGAVLADVVTQDLGLHAPWHPIRVVTGAILGWVVTRWMLTELDQGVPGALGAARTARFSRVARSASRKATCARAA